MKAADIEVGRYYLGRQYPIEGAKVLVVDKDQQTRAGGSAMKVRVAASLNWRVNPGAAYVVTGAAVDREWTDSDEAAAATAANRGHDVAALTDLVEDLGIDGMRVHQGGHLLVEPDVALVLLRSLPVVS